MSAFLSPFGSGQQFFTNQGVVLSGGKLYTYVAGSTTPVATYTDSSQATTNANPIILDSDGRPPQEIWISSGTSVKFVLTDSADVVIRTYDNIPGVNDLSGSQSQWVSSGVTPTYISATSFSVPGDQRPTFQALRRIQATISSGTIYATIATSTYDAINAITTVTIVPDSTSLDSGLSSVNVGLLTSVDDSVPRIIGLVPGIGVKNRLVNGAFDHWTRGASFAVTGATGVLTADRWFAYADGSTNATISQQTPQNAGSSFALRAQRNAGETSIQPIYVQQIIPAREVAKWAGEAVTLTVYLRAGANFSASSSEVAALLTIGTSPDEGISAYIARTWTGKNNVLNQVQAITTTSTQFAFSVTIPVTAKEIAVGIFFTPTGTAGSNDWFEMEQVQVEAGTVLLSVFENRPPELEKVLCEIPDPSNVLGFSENLFLRALGPRHLRNKLINANFDVWQVGTSLAASTGKRYLADQWYTNSVGTTLAPSQQSFTLGQTSVPLEPKYFHRAVVVSSAGSGNYAYLAQPVEGVRTFAGQTCVLSFYAKADAVKNIAVNVYQNFGTGGSPSSAVSTNGNKTLFALTTNWQKFSTIITLPSILGKTLGSNNDDALILLFWLDAGSSFNSVTGSLGQQSGTFDIAQVQLEPGSIATDFELHDLSDILLRCYRFYEVPTTRIAAYAAASTAWKTSLYYKATKRASTPATTLSTTASSNVGAGSVPDVNADLVSAQHTVTATGTFFFNDSVIIDARL